MLEKINKIILDHCLLGRKGIRYVKIVNIYPAKWAKIFKNILDNSLLIAKKIWKHIHPFSCNNLMDNLGILKWALPCHATCDDNPVSTMYYKRNYQKIFSRSQVINKIRFCGSIYILVLPGFTSN